jgi:ligand-binding sensor domain-containing protein/signal transduction histidine kinase
MTGNHSAARIFARLRPAWTCAAWLLVLGLEWLMPRVRAQEYLVQVWQTEQGLPQNTVNCVTRTRDGYCWVGTQHGLARFDGVRFLVFTSANTPAFKSDRISALVQDSLGDLWIGTEGGGVVRLSAGTFTNLSVVNGLSSDMVTCLAAGEKGEVWIGTVYGLNLWKDGRISTFGERDGLQGMGVVALASSPGHGLWIGANVGVSHWSEGRFTRLEPRTQVAGLADAGDGKMWVSGRTSGLFHGEPREPKTLKHLVPKARVTTLTAVPDGNAWAAMEDGSLRRFRNGEESTVQIPQLRGGVRCLYEDNEQNLWVGLNGSGLARLKEQTMRAFQLKDAAADNVVSVVQDAAGRIWAGGASGKLALFQNDGFYPVDTGRNFAGNGAILTLCPARDGSLWIGKRGGGLFHWNQGNVTLPDAGGKSIAAVVTALFEDRDNKLWIGTEAEGILSLSDGRFERFTTKDGFSADQANCIAQQPDGALWFGTAASGLNRMQEGKVTPFWKADGLAGDSVHALLVDSGGLLWVGAGTGLSLFRDGRFFSFTAKHGLMQEIVSQAAEDAEGFFWLGSNRGLQRVRREELLEVAAGKRERITVVTYGTVDGMPSPECPGGRQNAVMQDSDGRLWFTTMLGLVRLERPQTGLSPPGPPPITIERVNLNDEPALPDALIFSGEPAFPNGLSVPPGPSRLEFHFSAPSLRAPERLRFRYRLESMEDKWIYAGADRSAVYNQVPPGKYRFQVQACSDEGIWTPEGAALTVTVQPHYWQTVWFKAAMALLLALIAAGLLRLRNARRRELERVRLRIAGDLHDELGGNLSGIVLLSRRVGRQPALGERERSELDEVARIAAQTTQSVRDIVWFINPSCDTLEELILHMRETSAALLTGLEYEFHDPGAPTAFRGVLPQEFRRHVLLIFKEVLHNVVRHSGATRVEIDVKIEGQRFSVSVRDNGNGFDFSYCQHTGGLKNAQLRLQRLHGEIHIHSRPGEGAHIQFTAPVKRTFRTRKTTA